MIFPAIVTAISVIVSTAAITKIACDNAHDAEYELQQRTIDELELKNSKLE